MRCRSLRAARATGACACLPLPHVPEGGGRAICRAGTVRRESFAWTRGEPGIFMSSSLAQRFFCRHCGTPLGFAYLESPTTSVTIGSLDRPRDVVPTFNCGMESRLDWLDVLGAIPADPTEGVVPAERLARVVNRQHPDRETPPDWRPRS